MCEREGEREQSREKTIETVGRAERAERSREPRREIQRGKPKNTYTHFPHTERRGEKKGEREKKQKKKRS